MGQGYNQGGTSDSDIYGLLADQQRRYVLSYLQCTSGDVASLEELASHVGSRDPGATSENDVAVELHHVTLPMLDDAGLVEYDPRSGAVRYSGHPQLESLLDGEDEFDVVENRE